MIKKYIQDNFLVLFVVVCLCILIASILSLANETDNKYRTLIKSKESSNELDLILSSCYEMESTARGYSLTKNKDVSNTYKIAKKRLIHSTDKFLQNLEDIPLESVFKINFRNLINRRINLLDEHIKAQKIATKKIPVYQLIMDGDKVMDDIRYNIYLINKELQQKMDNEEIRLQKLITNTIIFIVLFTVFAATVVLYVFLSLKRRNEENVLLNESLIENKTLLDQAEQIANSGSWSWDIENNKLTCSNGVYAIFGINKEEEIIDFEVFGSIFHPNEAETINQKLQEYVSEEKAYTIDIKLLLKDGTEKIAYSRGEPKYVNDKLFYYGSIVDVTQLRKQQEEIVLRNEELEILNEELEQFAYVASHDLQEPLRKIRMFSNLMLEEYNRKNNEENFYLDRINNAAERMQNLIKDLLNFSRVSRNKGDYNLLDLNEIIKNVTEDLSLAIEEKNAELTIEPFQQLLKVNEVQIQQLFQNLLSNALKFTKEGIKPKISIQHQIIPSSGLPNEFNTEEEKFIKIVVSDNGIGFSQEYANKIFTIFQRLHGKTEYPGTGIGLAICEKICENHNGFIEAISNPNEGATFIVYLPM